MGLSGGIQPFLKNVICCTSQRLDVFSCMKTGNLFCPRHYLKLRHSFPCQQLLIDGNVFPLTQSFARPRALPHCAVINIYQIQRVICSRAVLNFLSCFLPKVVKLKINFYEMLHSVTCSRVLFINWQQQRIINVNAIPLQYTLINMGFIRLNCVFITVFFFHLKLKNNVGTILTLVMSYMIAYVQYILIIFGLLLLIFTTSTEIFNSQLHFKTAPHRNPLIFKFEYISNP